MNLLDALIAAVEAKRPSVTNARMAHFAFADSEDRSAFLSEIDIEELVPLLEQWCAEQRESMGAVH